MMLGASLSGVLPSCSLLLFGSLRSLSAQQHKATSWKMSRPGMSDGVFTLKRRERGGGGGEPEEEDEEEEEEE